MSAAPTPIRQKPSMFDDLLEVQKEMPTLQRTAMNPHFGNRYIPLEEIITTVVERLNAHNFVLMQVPTLMDGKPALTTTLMHASGEKLETTMLLLCSMDSPQSQGAAITYARRYSLMAMLGMVADRDEDGNAPRPPQRGQRPPQQRQQASSAPAARPPVCKTHGEAMRFVKGEKGASDHWRCIDDICASTVAAEAWRDILANEKKKPAAVSNSETTPGEPMVMPMVTQPQSKKIHVLLGKYEAHDIRLGLVVQQYPEMKGDDAKLHTSKLTRDRASKVIELLQRMETEPNEPAST